MIDDWVVAIIAACHRAPLFCRTNAPLDHGGCICLDAASEFAIKQSLTWIQDLEWRTRLSEKWNLGYGYRPATCLAMAWQPHIHVFDSKKKLSQIEGRLNAS